MVLWSHKVCIPVKGESEDSNLHKKYKAGNVESFADVCSHSQ